MGELLDNTKAKLDKMDDKAHELKGRAEQKAKDVKKDKETTDTH